MLPWRFVTMDVTHTLLRPRERIGATYLSHWQLRMGAVDPVTAAQAAEEIDRRFPLGFRQLSREQPNFGRCHGRWPPTAYDWWRTLLLDHVMPLELTQGVPSSDLDAFTHQVYDFYATGDAWLVFDDARLTLERLQAVGISLGGISNFDERLPSILRELGLRDYFDVLTTSWNHGKAKPDVSIFHATFAALQSNAASAGCINLTPGAYEDTLHVGDDFKQDYEGARAAGAHARLLCLSSSAQAKALDQAVKPSEILTSLLELTQPAVNQ